MISLMGMSRGLGISATQLARIKAICTGLLSVKAAVIFGSRSLGNYREGSDLDILPHRPWNDFFRTVEHSIAN